MKHLDSQFLRALAIVLIVNSHLDRYYPIPYIGTGGAIGNSVFFFLSAFGLYLSQQVHRRHFVEWFTHRISRIYPSLWIVLVALYMPLLICQGKLSYNTLITFIGNFFYPPFWFLQYLLIYYLLSFSLIQNSRKTNLSAVIGLAGLLYMAGYVSLIDLSRWSVEESPFDFVHYIMVFLFGIYVAKREKAVVYSGVRDYILLITIIGLFYAQKYMMLKGLYFEFQFLQQLAIYPILFFLLKISRSPLIQIYLTRKPALAKIINFIANNTLEIYMVHQTMSSVVLSMQMPFPSNLFVFLLLTLFLSAVVNKLGHSLRQCIS